MQKKKVIKKKSPTPQMCAALRIPKSVVRLGLFRFKTRKHCTSCQNRQSISPAFVYLN